MTGGGQEKQDGLLEEAAAWFARMRGPDAEASRPEFEAWLARGALHRAAYNRASEIFAMGKFLADDGSRQPASIRGLRGRPRRFVAAAIAATLLVALAGTWLLLRVPGRGGPAPGAANGSVASPAAELATAAAAQSIRLADGSLIRLQPATRIAVEFSAGARRLSLTQGSARFFVAHEARPFQVLAGGGMVTAHGTVFDVGLGTDSRVSVRLIEGSVDVTLPARPDRSSKPVRRRLRPGEGLSFEAAPADATSGMSTGARGAGANAAAPPALVEDVDGVRLAELVAAANKGAERPIRLADPALGEKRVSGRFTVRDTALLTERLALLFGLTVDRSDPRVIVLKQR
ncbi:MAG: FecR family protein [Bacillota bacterium]